MGLGVIVDGQFLPKSVSEISQNQEMHKVPFMIGVNNHEGGKLLASVSTLHVNVMVKLFKVRFLKHYYCCC